jgi:hypothetical protein
MNGIFKIDLNEIILTKMLGEIYKIENKINGKSYIGQCQKYVGKNKNKWNTNGRWKSHIREALGGCKDHCLLLNQAIRKYGIGNFKITKLKDCELNEMDTWEKFYIKKYNSLVPNGYNLTEGGSNGKDSDETREKKRQMRLGKKHSDEVKKNISKGQLGNRRNKKKRKYKEDENLPKYIQCIRNSGKIIGYMVKNFPIGVKKKKYIRKSFTNIYNPEETLSITLSYLNELKEKYSYLEEEIIENRKEENKKKVIKKKKKKTNDTLPENIFSIYDESILIGYYVDNILDNNGNKYPKKKFTDKTNRWNLNSAKKYKKSLLIKNADELFEEKLKSFPMLNTSHFRKYKEDNVLPNYIASVRQNNKRIGFTVAGVKLKDTKKLYTRKFTDQYKTLEEKYNLALEHLNQLENKEYQ